MRGRPGRAIVVGYADSEASRRALTVAAELAADLGARLAVVHVVDLRDYPADPDLPDWEGAGAARLAAERTEVEGILANWSGQWTYELVRGEPARAIADIAAREHARMIVVGSRGGSGFGAALDRVLSAARSVTHSLERADTPVLVVPAHSAPKTGKPGARP
ncbi:MAG: universal stress protein [Jatrophihabitantaceae bacterium]